MFQEYFQAFNDKVPIEEEDMSLISPYLKLKKLSKKESLLSISESCNFIAFVQKGMLRAYSIDENGNEQVVQFAPEGWHVSDLYSFLTGEKAKYFIDALENSEVVIISKDDHENLLKTSSKYEIFTRELITAAYVALQRRFNMSLSSSPDQCYSEFMAKYSDIANRVPQHMIASYLGLTPETLSRVRRRIIKKNT